jgi:putative hydrolase of HD superfamily
LSHTLIVLWKEFESKKAPEAKFAAALDRIEPVMQNYLTNGYTWKELNVSHKKVLSTNEHIINGSEKLWEYVKSIIDETFETKINI